MNSSKIQSCIKIDERMNIYSVGNKTNIGLPIVIWPLDSYLVPIHPPHWYPISWAWVPATRTLLAFLFSGRKGLLGSFPFFNRTKDFWTVLRARSLCSCRNNYMVKHWLHINNQMIKKYKKLTFWQTYFYFYFKKEQ